MLRDREAERKKKRKIDRRKERETHRQKGTNTFIFKLYSCFFI